MWRMTSADGKRWVQFDDQPGPGRVSASAPELAGRCNDPGPVEIAPMSGQFHTPPAGAAADSLAVFLRAEQILGQSARLTGQPPRRPQVTEGIPDDAVA